MITLTGQTANDYTRVMVQNAQTPQGRVNKMVESFDRFLPFLFAALLIGGAFAFLTRSKYAAVIPVTAAVGISLVLTIGAWVDYIKWVMLGITVTTVLWRGVVWQKERNAAEKLVK